MTSPFTAAFHGRFARCIDARAFVAFATAVMAALVFLPFLGSVGLWDPWEPHYAEVGREMLERGDFIHPHWQDQWFFSKPAFTPWLSAVGLFLAGATPSSPQLPPLTEWFIRLPFAGFSIAAVSIVSHHVARLASPKAGLLTGFILTTSPLWFFVSRQAMTDMPCVASVTISCISFLRLGLDTSASRRWLFVGWLAAAVATLAKGALGVALPLGICFLVSATHTRPVEHLRATFKRLCLNAGPALWAGTALPWYTLMFQFDGLDGEGKTFFQRFVLHDHFARFTGGVFSTTVDSSFTYFIEQAGYGFFPWSSVVILALLHQSPQDDNASSLKRAAWVWLAFVFALFTWSATKFHHYALPMLPPLAIVVALTLESIARHDVVNKSILAFCGAVALFIGKDLAEHPRRWIELFSYDQNRPYPAELDGVSFFRVLPNAFNAHTVTWTVAALAAAACVSWAVDRSQPPRKNVGLAALALSALVSALWFSWGHWVGFSQHWTQRMLFDTYFKHRRNSEPIAAFYMDWKGETFYSQNQVLQLGPANWKKALPQFLAPSGRKWMLVEHSRRAWLTQAIGEQHTIEAFEPSLNNKFVLLLLDNDKS